MTYDTPLIPGTLLRRYKRFLADVELADGRVVTAHSANTGSMTGCSTPGARVWLRDSGNPARKYPLTWELVEAAPGVPVGINTHLANTLVREGIENGTIGELGDYRTIRTEVRYGNEHSRIDLLLEDDTRPVCWVEVKSVTLVENSIACFPDAVSARGAKHLRELAQMAAQGDRAVIFFCVQRGDADEIRPADHIDPAYGRALRDALAAGVEALGYRASVSPEGIRLVDRLPVISRGNPGENRQN